MNFTRMISAAPCLFAALLTIAPAFAVNERSWVANNGSDANPCTVSAPCLTFQHAHDVTVNGGEVDALTPGDFGTVFITKAITIDGGNMAYIEVPAGKRGIYVSAIRNNIVVIRNLSINNAESATTNFGIDWINGQVLHIENVTINGLWQGIEMVQSASETTQRLFLKDVIVRDCTYVGINVIATTESKSLATVSVDHATVANNANGAFFNSANATVVRSTFSSNAGAGIGATQGGVLNIEDSTIVNSQQAIDAGNNSIIRIAGNNIHDNHYAFAIVGSGQVISFGNNRILGNALVETPTSTVSLK